ncbi:hypothetical protein F5I97DRAFT_1931691 [Phlebopus sp. FC_14]|nr:hypothetical protein F5I97DRAFT_1931691 [Phlebopus sp. FC_14]
MSRLSRAVNVSLRSVPCSLKESTLAPPRTPASIRQSSAQAQQTESNTDDDARFAAHLNSVFPSLHFPPQLAKRILTHSSHKAAVHGHNGRLGFVGRRVLESYYLLLVHEVSQGHGRDYELLASRALNTYLLGEHVAPLWSLGRVLRWVPTIPQETLKIAQQQTPVTELDDTLRSNPGIVRSVGLYKVMGEAVQAVMGGVYHQFGGSVAHRFFHTRILPHILLPGNTSGVPEEFHVRALSICGSMGGKNGPLMLRLSPHNMTETPKFAEMKPMRRVAAVGR